MVFQTSATLWNAKRIRRASPVMVWIAKRDRPAFVAKAELTIKLEVIRRIVEKLSAEMLFRPDRI
jgi:hypothetical protein